MKGLEKYSPKILVAWGEAISGNTGIRDLLMKSENYKELGVFCFALRNDKGARIWLLKGFPHLMALINGAEHNLQANQWLERNGYTVLLHMAKAGDAEMESLKWLQEKAPLLAIIAAKILTVKTEIEDDNIDPHKITP